MKRNQKSYSTDLAYLVAESRRMFDAIVEEKQKSIDTKNDFSRGLVQYNVNGDQFLPVGKTVLKLPAGWYNLVYNSRCDCYLPQLCSVKNEELIKLPIPEYGAVLSDITKFWASEADYRKYKFAYKRGIILYGEPGTGKSALVKLLADDLIQKDGIVFNIGQPDDIFKFENIFSQFREIEPNRNAIAVLEDIDNFVRYGGNCISKLLNILDGNMKYDNLVFIATTNFPEILLSSLVNRPSRFDRRYKIGVPSVEAREVYIRTKFKELPQDEAGKVVAATEGFSLDMLKELIVSIYVLKYPFEEAIKEIKDIFSYGKRVDSTDDNLVSERDEFNNEIE